jgi:hypothetical protein
MTNKSKIQFLIKKVVPQPVWRLVRSFLLAVLHRLLREFDLVATKRNDFSSPLPDLESLRVNRERWDKPSAMIGVPYDLDDMKSAIETMTARFGPELKTDLPSYDDLQKLGLGWGMPYMDLQVLYLMLRQHRPARYLEIGSGTSTYVASLAARKNAADGQPCTITCVEPYPNPGLISLAEITLIKQEAQSVKLSLFDMLTDGDILFIDSSHVAKIDSDVPFLLLEVLPRLNPGVIVHVHDTPFPYNTPYPSDFWIFHDTVPPMFWNEAMFTQAFLYNNDSFQIKLSAPLLRYHCESFLRAQFPGYQDILAQPNSFSSLWMKRVK